jgi:hypothetical protein
MQPRARREGLIVQEVADELVVYDRRRDNVHRLNRTASLVWRRCDGTLKVEEIAACLKSELDPAADEELVWQTLEKLESAELLEQPLALPAGNATTRRRAIGTLSLLLPAISTIVAPRPAAATSVILPPPPPIPVPVPPIPIPPVPK